MKVYSYTLGYTMFYFKNKSQKTIWVIATPSETFAWSNCIFYLIVPHSSLHSTSNTFSRLLQFVHSTFYSSVSHFTYWRKILHKILYIFFFTFYVFFLTKEILLYLKFRTWNKFCLQKMHWKQIKTEFKGNKDKKSDFSFWPLGPYCSTT